MSAISVANFLECSVVTLYRYERGDFEPSNETLLTLAQMYGVTTDFLLAGDSV